jgi:hypothetical protein
VIRLNASIVTLAVAMCVTMAGPVRAEWTPPLGVPAPSFGIQQVAPAAPNPWVLPAAGFYYVEPSNPLATDTANPYGTPALPRDTIPVSLPAGAVVELHGAYDTSHSSPRGIVMNGTSAAPVFVRGASATNRPVISNYWEVSGSYFVLENLEFAAAGAYQGRNQLYVLAPTNFGAIRFSDLHGTFDHGGISLVGYTSGTAVSNFVVYGNRIHDNGDVNATNDQDVHGIGVGERVQSLWIVDNELFNNSGDGIQINAGQTNQATTHHIYVGRNRSHHNKQTGMWTKQAVDVVFSQNVVYAHRPGNSSFGACMGFQYAPQRVWFLFNVISDCDYGIGTGSDSGLGSGTESFFIGNVIHSIHHTGTYNAGTGWSNAAISLPGGVNRYVVGNTIYGVDAGVVSPGSTGKVYVVNNVISGITEAQGTHIFLEMSSLATSSTMHHNLLDSPARIKWGSSTVYSLDSFQAAFAGKGTGSLVANPLFVNPTTFDLRLQSGSLAVDAGVVDTVYQTFFTLYGIDIAKDANGETRPLDAAFDIGAYELSRSAVPPSNLRIR